VQGTKKQVLLLISLQEMSGGYYTIPINNYKNIIVQFSLILVIKFPD